MQEHNVCHRSLNNGLACGVYMVKDQLVLGVQSMTHWGDNRQNINRKANDFVETSWNRRWPDV